SDRYAAELAAIAPDVWVCGTPANTRNAHNRPPDTPIVFVAVPDPIGEGFIRAFNDPGGSITGVAHFEPSVGGKQMSLLLEIAPSLRNAGYIFSPAASNSRAQLRPFVSTVADAAGVALIDLPRPLETMKGDGTLAAIAATWNIPLPPF